MDVPHRGTNLRSRFFFLFLWPSHKSPYRFEDPSCAFGAALLQGPTQLARWTFSRHMRQFLNAFPLREGGGQRPGWMCFIEAQICVADSSFSFLRLYDFLISRPTDSKIHPAPLARSFSKGLLAGTIRHWLSYRRRLTICLLFSRSLRRCAGGLPQGRF